MTSKHKIILILIMSSVFMLASMIDFNPHQVEKENRLVDCEIGNYIFQLKAKDCKND